MCEGCCLKAEPASLEWVSPVAFGVQVLLEFGWQLGTVSERLNRKNPKFTQRFGEKRKPSLVGLKPYVQLQPVPVAKEPQMTFFFEFVP